MKEVIIRQYMDCIIHKKLIENELNIIAKCVDNKEYRHMQDIEQVELCKQYKKELHELKIRIQELRNMALETDELLYRKLLMMEHNYGMDELSSQRKEECLAFASAVNAVEGVGASVETLNDLQEWKQGNLKFIDVLENVFGR